MLRASEIGAKVVFLRAIQREIRHFFDRITAAAAAAYHLILMH